MLEYMRWPWLWGHSERGSERGKLLVSESESPSVMSNSLQPHGLYSPWNTSGQNTAMGSLFFLQGSSQLRVRTHFSLIAGGFFTS